MTRPQFSMRFLLAAATIASLLLGAVGYIKLNKPRWDAHRARREALIKQQQAWIERQQKIDAAKGKALLADIYAFRDKFGRFPNDESELVAFRGKPLHMLHSDGEPCHPIEYRKDGMRFVLTYRYYQGPNGLNIDFKPGLLGN